MSRMEGSILGRPANISCLVSGWPRPNVFWTSDTGRLIQAQPSEGGPDQLRHPAGEEEGEVQVSGKGGEEAQTSPAGKEEGAQMVRGLE